MTFGVISYRFVEADLVSLAAVPIVYSLAMAVEAVAALGTGHLFDRHGVRVLLAVALWGLATGVLDSTVNAYVADIALPAARHGVRRFAAIQGIGALAGGGLADCIGVLQLVSFSLLLHLSRRSRRRSAEERAPSQPKW
jgi:MFS family permease